MKVTLVSHSEANPALFGLMSNSQQERDLENLVAYCARVSNPSNQHSTETNSKLLAYLIKHKHWSPFEMVSVCLEIETTRDIARQILRHRSFSFQEFSQRYADVSALGDMFEYREARLQDTKNRQNSIETEDSELEHSWVRMQQKVMSQASEAYKWAIANGIAKEQARTVLPEGLTKSRLYVNGTLRSWIHFIELRSGNGTQKEHMLIARECAKVISNLFPYVNEVVQ